jgi:hypothetical protein
MQYTEEMDLVRKLLRDLMAEAGAKESPLSKQLGKNAAYLNQYFERGSPKMLPEDVRDKLGVIFNVDPDSFKTGRRMVRTAVQPGPILLEDVDPIGRVVGSGAMLLPDDSTALILQLDVGDSIVVQVDQDAAEQLRKNLSTIEHHLRRGS